MLDTAWHLVLPVITLTLAYLAEYSLIMRSSLLDEIGEDYLTTARAKGLRDVVVRRRHAVRNALLPTTTVAALSIGFVVSGAITIETVFSIPGLGLLASEALTDPDYWVLQGTFLIAAAGVILANLRGQPDLRPARPAGADMTTVPAGTVSAAALARRRRAESLRRNWRLFRSHRSGLFGLGTAAVLRRAGRLRAAARRPRRAWRSPRRPAGSSGAPLAGVLARHRRERPLDPHAADLGLPGLAVRRPVRDADLDGDRHPGRAASGYLRGVGREVLFRITEWFLVLPFLPLALILATILGRGLLNIAMVIGITSWPATALLIRSQTLSIRERPYLERARVLGAGRWHQITRHVLPNVMPMVFANTTLTVAAAILTETTLSFLGLGDPTRVSWGSMLDDAFSVGAMTTGAWWYIVPPGVCVVLVVLAFTLVGQALEDVFNPRLRER